MGLARFIRRHRIGTSITAFVMVAALTFGLAWFQPWKLWTNTRVDEAIPTVAEAALTVSELPGPTTSRTGATVPSLAASDTARPTPPTQAPSGPRQSGTSKSGTSKVSTSNSGTPNSGTPNSPPKPQAVQLLSGSLISHEHETSGSVGVIELADGRRVLTLENLVTSDGPDVHVWLSAAPVIPGVDGWYVFDDQAHADLGELKGNLGSQVYEIPPGVDLDQLSNVSLWCERFAVSFGAAELG